MARTVARNLQVIAVGRRLGGDGFGGKDKEDVAAAEAAARELGLQLHVLHASTESDLDAVFVPNRNCVYWASVARAQQALAVGGVRLHEHRRPALIEHERLGRLGDAVAEADAQRAVDADAQLTDGPFLEIAHIPSNPSSLRALSMIAGVISVMPRSRA